MGYEREPWDFEETRKGRLVDAREEANRLLRRSGQTAAAAYFGVNPTATEAESGTAIAEDNAGPLRKGSAGHRALAAFAAFDRRVTAYQASQRATGDYHALRREATRLLVRGFLRKDGVLPNPAPRGREHVDAFVLTDAGRTEIARLGRWP